MFDQMTQGDVLVAFTIPVVSGLVGWGTNVLAIKMMFHPAEFRGLGSWLGWQGVIPANATKMARIASETLATHLIRPEEMVKRIDAKAVAKEVEPMMLRLSEPIVAEVIEEHLPMNWDQVPPQLKEATYARVQAELPGEISTMVDEVMGQLDQLVDVQAVAVQAFADRSELVPELFQRCGEKEFIFIGRSGLGFGFLFGLVQMLVWLILPSWWILPAAGLLVGYVTNWLALKMIFEPLEPTRYGPFSWHGLFLKRQSEVSVEYATIFAREVLTPARIANHVLQGPASMRLAAIVHRHLLETIGKALEPSEAMVRQMTSDEQLNAIKNGIANRLLAAIPGSMSEAYPYAEEAMDIQTELTNNLEALPPERFEQILRPIFQEDEWILITVGAVLGALAGLAQASWLITW